MIPSGERSALMPAPSSLPVEVLLLTHWLPADGPSTMAATRAPIDVLADLHNNTYLQDKAHAQGLEIVQVSWDDTERKHMSTVGPNICDLTLSCQGMWYMR